MTIYRFSVGYNGTLICIKADKQIEKYSGEKALELFNHVKNFSYHTFNSILKNDSNNNKYFNMEFISNNHSVTYVNINKFQSKAKNISIEKELKDIMSIVKKNNIAIEREQLNKKRKMLEMANKAKAILGGAFLGSVLTYGAYNQCPQDLAKPFKVEKVLEYDSSLKSSLEIDDKIINEINNYLDINTNSPENIISEEKLNRANAIASVKLHLEEVKKVMRYKQELERIKKEEEENKWQGQVLTSKLGVVYDTPSGGMETYYDADVISKYGMNGVVKIMRDLGYSEEKYPYYIREDGVRMLGNYVMVAANLDTYPRGTIIETTLGTAIVCDMCENASIVPDQLDVAVNWTKKKWK